MTGLPPETYRNLLLSVGRRGGRRPLTPVEVAAAIEQLTRAGAPLRQVATDLQLEGTSVLSRFLQLRRLPREVQELVDWGRSGTTLAFTTAAELARLAPAEAVALATAALEYQMSKEEVRGAVQLRLRSARPLADCVREVLAGRPQVTRLHLLIGAVTSPEVRDRLGALSQGGRDEVMAAALARAFPAAGVAGRLGADRFTICGGDEAAASVAAGGDDFESAINSALLAEVLDAVATSR